MRARPPKSFFAAAPLHDKELFESLLPVITNQVPLDVPHIALITMPQDCSAFSYWGFHKRIYPKWMVFLVEKPNVNGWFFRGTPVFREKKHMIKCHIKVAQRKVQNFSTGRTSTAMHPATQFFNASTTGPTFSESTLEDSSWQKPYRGILNSAGSMMILRNSERF